MFTLDPTLTHLDATRDRVASISESVNHPHVGVPGREAQATSGFVVGMRNDDDTYAIYVYLWLTRSREAVVYPLNDRRLDADEYEGAQAEALQFCESMGFIMESVPYRNLRPEAQDELLATLPPFLRDPSPPQLESNLSLHMSAGPSMNSPMTTGFSLGPERSIELLLETADEPPAPEPVDTTRLARLLASF